MTNLVHATYLWPGQTQVGFGTANHVGTDAKTYGGSRAFVITDSGVVALKLHEIILQSLEQTGIAFELYSNVVPNPDSDSVDACAAALRASGADIVIGLGGGSALDTAKAARIVASGPPEGKVAEYAGRLGDKARPSPRQMIPYIAIPTTAGTGAEVTPWAVMTDLQEKFKFGVGGVFAIPTLAIVDPELMMGLPPFLTAATGMDALSHLIEAYVSVNFNPVLDPLALYGIELVARSLPVAVARGDNRQARHDMAVAAMVGGIVISSKWLGACHSLAHQLSGFANVQHGLANSIMLPHEMRYSMTGAYERYARVADALGVPPGGSVRQRAESAAEAVALLAADVGLPARLRDVGVTDEMIPPMAKLAYTVDLNWWTNPRSVNEEVMAQLYRAAY